MNEEKKRILVLAAHLDDEVLGVGGTIAKSTQRGHEAYIHILRDGIAERHFDSNSADGSKRDHVKECAIGCAEVLGVPADNVTFGGFSLYDPFYADDRLIRSGSNEKSNVPRNIEEVMLRTRPHIIYTHHHGDTHRDHGVVNQGTMIAVRAISGSYGCLQRVLSYEVPSSTEQSFKRPDTAFMPNVFVDISGDPLETKIRAFQEYDTEQKQNPHPRSPEKIKALAAYRGGEANVNAAEAFCLLREVQI